MAVCPFATFRPLTNRSNFGGPMGKVIGLVLHVQVGNGSLYGWFNGASGVSAHFWASKAGALEQYLQTADQTSYAQGAGNANYLSVESEGFPDEPLTSAQLSTIANLLAWSADLYGFPVAGPVAHGVPGFSQHCRLDGSPDPAWSNHSCPDPLRMGQMPTIVQLANGPTEEVENVTSLVLGGQLHVWGIIGTQAFHWWQEIGPPSSAWHVEPMPT